MLPHLFPKNVLNQPKFDNEYNCQSNSSNLSFDTNSVTNSFQNFFSTLNQSTTTTLKDNISFFTQNLNNGKVGFIEPTEFTKNNNNCIVETNLAQQNLQSQTITITLQYGSQKKTLVVERTQNPQMFELFRQEARKMVERQLKNSNNLNNNNRTLINDNFEISIGEIQLFLHNYKSANMLEYLSTLAQLDNGSVIEIIRIERNERPTRLHELQVMSYITPTFCDYCGEILVGLIKQGLQCLLCKCNFHKKCAFAPRNNCSKNDAITSSVFLNSNETFPSSSTNIGGQQFGNNVNTPNLNTSGLQNFQLPHTLSVYNYKTPTVCKICDKMLLGFVKQGLRCRDCKVNVHKKCASLLPANCQITTENTITPSFDQMSFTENSSAQGSINICTVSSQQHLPQTQDLINYNQRENIIKTSDSNDLMLIPLARLPGCASSRTGRQGPICEGWMIHFVLQKNFNEYLDIHRRLRHYWVLENGEINMYNEYNDGVNPCRVYKKIQLAEIIAINSYNGSPITLCHPPHCFEIKTTSNITYCVGENLESLSFGNAPPTKLPKQASPHGVTSWQAWFQALQQSLQPPVLRTDPLNTEPAFHFTQLYQICRDKLLGSGQFGTVYSGIHRQTAKEVAIKVIAKDRFSKKSNVETLKSEVAILQAVDHQGIIKLESMFETKDKIFVVMEKMNGDMLEMILSQATGRLNERNTKYLIMQILSALRYLHSRGIAHCDLKPENVLLSDFHSNFPQTKLCDFGYARFIGDAQFRKTIVGTPAYLAPEVLKKKGYNKSLDMWSVGVIIYVTLSGTFPFNDGEEISDQIHNAAFMFPSNSWKNISLEAIDLIQNLLRVQIEERLNIDECITHNWLQDPEVYFDLSKLEKKLGCEPYLTTSDDYIRFASEFQHLKTKELSNNKANSVSE